MQSYELAFLLKKLPKPELTTVLKRCANAIFEKGGIIRKIDNLGERKIPYKTSKHGAVHREASYFVYTFSAPPSKLADLDVEYKRDIDMIRSRIFKSENNEEMECTLEEEMKPAPYRSEVIKMIEEGKKKEARKPKFKYNTDLDYYPFQK